VIVTSPTRPPATPQGRGDEPDYRFTLANERTFLAWIRTSLALLAAGVAVVNVVPSLAPRPQRLALGLALTGLALLLAATSHRRWSRIQQAIRLGQPLPHTRMPAIVAAGLSVVIILTVVLLVRG
jgi:putative membrane protein